ncbi:MAG: SPOR domain-containing protein [Bdellovibrionales bacterium]|nr:SPOR domain-containing protein [Bdellovibrionales bacterium]
MDPRSRFFVYDRKEMVLLILLGVAVALFAFTLGIHLGKTVGEGARSAQEPPVALLTPGQDRVPTRPDFAEQEKKVAGAADETLFQELHDEVGKSGVQLNPPRQVKLPEQAISEKAPAAEGTSPADSDHPSGRFTIQVGSFPSAAEASAKAAALSSAGMQPFVRAAEVPGKGEWHRVYIGGFGSEAEAQKEGQRLQQSKAFDSFIVARMPR